MPLISITGSDGGYILHSSVQTSLRRSQSKAIFRRIRDGRHCHIPSVLCAVMERKMVEVFEVEKTPVDSVPFGNTHNLFSLQSITNQFL